MARLCRLAHRTARPWRRYNFSDPEYFAKAASDPLDYIGRRIVNESQVQDRCTLTP